MITQEKKVTDLVNQMNEEQLKDYIKICNALDIFNREMKIRFAEKSINGRVGWDNNVFSCAEEIIERGERMLKGEEGVNIGVANWAFIDWYEKNKYLIK